MTPDLLDCVAEQRLVDHHCHGVLVRDADAATLESLLTEGPGVPGGSAFDSQAGFAFRRLCPPVLGLPPHAELDDYLARRAELGVTEVSRRFLRAAGLAAMCVDTGFTPEPVTDPGQLGGLAAAAAHEVVRLERVAEDVAAAGADAAGFADAVRSALAARTASAAGVKCIAAYRTGLDLSAARPSDAEVRAAAGRWLSRAGLRGGQQGTPPGADLRGGQQGTSPGAGAPRLADETLERFLIWCGVDLRLPVQFHVGYGDSDVDLHRCNPLLLTPLLRAIEPTGVPVMLLHNYPYHREAGYLAQVFGNVYVDAGLATHNLGARAPALLAEALELAPYRKFLYSSDAFGLPELHYLGAALFRRALSRFLAAGIAEDLYPERAVARLARMFCADNARRAYRLGEDM
ncbi:MAG TPA: amidohydrolase family protein [Streptosporangiaceae bacterium]|nr:amidohydrolase family protein [Streptosporangiaceae bacterium]